MRLSVLLSSAVAVLALTGSALATADVTAAAGVNGDDHAAVPDHRASSGH